VYEIFKGVSFHVALGLGLSYVGVSLPSNIYITDGGVFQERTRVNNLRPQGLISGTLRAKLSEDFLAFASYSGRAGINKTNPYTIVRQNEIWVSTQEYEGRPDLWGVYRIGITKQF